MTGKSVLIIEDEEKIAHVLNDYLVQAGFTVTWLESGEKAAHHVENDPPSIVLLDLMLPGMDGLDVCRSIRSLSDVPLIMITAKAEEVDRLIGLELGADDYICKPFSPREVVARVKAVLRRTRLDATQPVLRMGPIVINNDLYQVTINGRELTLTPSEFKLLQTLMRRPNCVFSRAALIDKVQGYSFDGYDRTIDSHIKNLRKKIAAVLADENVIHAVYGVGYKFVPPDSDEGASQ